MTEFRVIERYPEYEINRDGCIRRISTGALVPISKTIDRGYRVVLDNRIEYLSRILAETFMRKPSIEHTDVRYKDKNKNNYSLDNIEWATHSQTQYDSFGYGACAPGGNTPPKPVLDKETNISYPSIKACARSVGLAPVQIRRGLGARFELL